MICDKNGEREGEGKEHSSPHYIVLPLCLMPPLHLPYSCSVKVSHRKKKERKIIITGPALTYLYYDPCSPDIGGGPVRRGVCSMAPLVAGSLPGARGMVYGGGGRRRLFTAGGGHGGEEGRTAHCARAYLEDEGRYGE